MSNAEARIFAKTKDKPSVDTMVRGIVQQKMRVRLDAADGREIAQRAWDCYQNILLELWEKVQAIEAGTEPDVANFWNYAAVTAYNTVSDELRRGNKDRTRLKSRLRRFLSKQSSFALWAGDDEQFWCGFAGWAAQRVQRAPAAKVAAVPRMPVKPLELMKAEDWHALLEAVFEELDGPVWLDTLVSLLTPWFGFFSQEEPEPEAGPGEELTTSMPSPERQAQARMWLSWVWTTMAGFDRRWQLVFFLNPPMDNRTKERGEVQVFPQAGIASIADIGQRLALTDEEYATLRRELDGQPPSLPAEAPTPEFRFAAIWPHLPLADDRIASMLGLTRQQIANLRITMLGKLDKLWDDATKPKAAGTPSLSGGR